MHQGPRKRDWFHSWEFRLWYIGMDPRTSRQHLRVELTCILGCMVSFLGLFATTLMTRRNLETVRQSHYPMASTNQSLVSRVDFRCRGISFNFRDNPLPLPASPFSGLHTKYQRRWWHTRCCGTTKHFLPIKCESKKSSSSKPFADNRSLAR